MKNFGDRVNPDAAKDPKAATAEETVLGLLLLREEYRNVIEQGSIELNEQHFVTEFNRRVFCELMTRHKSEGGLHFEMLGECFNPDEMGRIQKMEVARQQLSQNGIEVFRSAVETLKNTAKEKEIANGDLNARIAYLREKKAKLHKGKADIK